MSLSGVVLAVAVAAFSWLSSPSASANQAVGTVGAIAVAAGDIRNVAQPSGQDAQSADLERVKTAFELRFDGLDVTEVRATPVPGLYEVQVGMDLIYVDASVDYVFQGSLLDAHTKVDLTAARLQQISEVPFDSLPVELAIKIVRGDGSRKLAVFEDPNCMYCKQLHASLSNIDNITLYSFQFPILSPDSIAKSRDIWCAADPAAALQAWMLHAEVPATARCDDNPAQQVLELGKSLMVRGTPAILFADGSRVNGALPVDQLRLKLDSLN